jgi:thiamine-monophosphate kinase
MIDISDGLARSLHQLAEASGVGFQVEYEKLPILPEVRELAADEPERREMALYTGEDFELLFAVPPEKLQDVQKNIDCRVIGRATAERRVLLEENGEHNELPDRGYEH